MVEFWKGNVNIITGFTSLTQPKKKETNLKGLFLKDSELQPYVCVGDMRKEFGIGAKKIKDIFISLGDTPRFNNGSTYYLKKNKEKAIELIHERNTIKIVDMSSFISNKELMKMFGFNTFKAFYIADKEKLEKKRFSGNVNYYEKEKAIRIFSKYK